MPESAQPGVVPDLRPGPPARPLQQRQGGQIEQVDYADSVVVQQDTQDKQHSESADGEPEAVESPRLEHGQAQGGQGCERCGHGLPRTEQVGGTVKGTLLLYNTGNATPFQTTTTAAVKLRQHRQLSRPVDTTAPTPATVSSPDFPRNGWVSASTTMGSHELARRCGRQRHRWLPEPTGQRNLARHISTATSLPTGVVSWLESAQRSIPGLIPDKIVSCTDGA